MYRTLLLMICSTSRTFANVNDSAHITNGTPPIEHSFPSKNPDSVRLLILNDTHSQNVSVTSTPVGVNLTLPVKGTAMLNHSIAFTTPEVNGNILLKIHRTVTRSKDAVWATITLTFICVLLLLAVAQSRMWKDYRVSEFQGVPLPDFNERVLFRDVMEHKLKSFKRFFKKQKKKTTTEMVSLIASSELEGEGEDIP